ncbi:MAG: sigma factor, partial [Planctomycetota bacterium]
MTVDLHPPEMTKSGRSGRQEIFLELLDGVYVDLHAYVRSLILNRSDSDDVLQDVCVVLWTKFDEFEFGTSFRKWALAVAYQRARAYWRDCKRYRGFALTEQVLAKFSQAFDASIEIQ